MPNSMQQPTGTPTSPSSQDGLNTADTQCKNSKPTKADSTKGSGSQSGRGLTVVVLPWPPTGLNPNARLHHMALAKTKKAYKEACMWQAKADGVKPMTADALHLTITFVPPDRRHRDLDNMLSSIKAGLDGLRDVLGVDDSKWSLTIQKADAIGGMVKVEVAHA